MSTIPDTARWYAKNGIPIFPLRPGTKKPLTDHGFKDATSDPQQIEQWWKENRDANIGIPMGAVSRLLLLDLDYRGKSVVADRDDVIRQFGPLPETCEVITGSGGRHIYFHFDGGKVPKQIAPGVELKADGGYAVAPPSIHPNGQRYTFDGEDGAKALLSVAAPPAWLLNIICAGNAGANQKNAAAAGTTWGEGERNNRLTSVAGKLRRTSLSVEAITAALLEENRMHCEPPWRKQRCAASRSLFAATRQHPQQHSTRLFSLDRLPPTLDLLNGLAMFVGRIEFHSVKRRGPMIIATTAEGTEVVWPTATDLACFRTSRAIIADATSIFLPTPPVRSIREQWEPAASLLLRLASDDKVIIEHPLREETRDLLRLMWRQSGQASAKDGAGLIFIMRAIQSSRRDPRGEAPPSVFIAEECCWVHVPTLRLWLSTPSFTNKHYPLSDIRNGLLLLSFEYFENLTRRADGDSESLCLWRGPLEVLSGNDSPDSPS